MKPRLLLILAILICSGCASYSIVKSGPRDINGFIVSPSLMWNKAPSSVGASETWTADGLMLNSVAFFSGIANGKPLFRDSGTIKFPVFNASMLPNEIMDMAVSSIGLFYKLTTSDVGGLKPASIGGAQGFEFTLNLVGQDNVKRKGYVAAAIKNENLYLVFYQAPAIHYYDKYYPEVNAMVMSASIE